MGSSADQPLPLSAGVSLPHMHDAVRAAWLAGVYQVAREIGATVSGPAEPPTVGRNYYRIPLRMRDGHQLWILLNAAINLVAAVTEPQPYEIALRFCDVPRGDLFLLAGMGVATRAKLEESLSEQDLGALADEDRYNIRYFSPERVGELLFNWYD